jgi:predicted DNA-binding transcriptional regulator YafY
MSKAKRAKRGTPHPRKKGKAGQNGDVDFWGHGPGRPGMARMEAIRALISEGKYPNSHTIARELEWSVRTVKRDLSLMQNRLNLPMEFDPQKNGWYFTKPVPFFPSIPLTEKEVVGLFVAQKSIEQYKGTALEPVLNGAFRKMMAGLDDAVKYSLGNLDEVVSIRPLAPGDADMEKFQLFTRAIREKRVVRFVYRKHGKVTTAVKLVHPHHVAYVNNLWTLFACDPKAKGIRKFVFLRVTGLELTDERFAVAQRLDLNKELEGSMGVFKGTEKHEVIVEFDAWGADDVRGRKWHASQDLKDRPDSSLVVTMTLNNLEEVERWVLGFGEHATVVKPEELKERVRIAAEKVTAKYGKHTELLAEGKGMTEPLGR